MNALAMIWDSLARWHDFMRSRREYPFFCIIGKCTRLSNPLGICRSCTAFILQDVKGMRQGLIYWVVQESFPLYS